MCVFLIVLSPKMPLPRSAYARTRRRGSARGFSLLELLVVLTVGAILLAVTIPAFQNQRAKSEVREGAEALLTLLQQAAAEAPVRSQPMTVSFQATATPWCVGVAVNSVCDCTDPNACTVPVAGDAVTKRHTGSVHPNVTMTHTFTGNSTSFEPIRGRASVPGALTLSSRGWSLELRVSAEGRIRTCNPGARIIAGYEAC